MRMLSLDVVGFTHQGAVRPANEDTIAIGAWIRNAPLSHPERRRLRLDLPCLLLVADGMGGHAAGEVASRAIAEALVQQVERVATPDALMSVIQTANRAVFELMRERPTLRGMGTTIAGLVVTPERLTAFNVGDSRVHRIWPGRLEQLSTDDTPGPKQPDGRTAVLTSSIITQVIGGSTSPVELTPHVLDLPLEADARFLISSDGLTDLVPANEIAAAIDDHPVESVERLFHAAMAAGGVDNVSLVLARVVEDADAEGLGTHELGERAKGDVGDR